MKHTERDERTGRYTHTWDWQGFDSNGVQWSGCDGCGRWKNDRTGKTYPPTHKVVTYYDTQNQTEASRVN